MTATDSFLIGVMSADWSQRHQLSQLHLLSLFTHSLAKCKCFFFSSCFEEDLFQTSDLAGYRPIMAYGPPCCSIFSPLSDVLSRPLWADHYGTSRGLPCHLWEQICCANGQYTVLWNDPDADSAARSAKAAA